MVVSDHLTRVKNFHHKLQPSSKLVNELSNSTIVLTGLAIFCTFVSLKYLFSNGALFNPHNLLFEAGEGVV